MTRRAAHRVFVVGCAAALCASAAIAFQQRIVGGFSLDANTAVEGGGINTPAWRAGTPGVQRQRYTVGGRSAASNSALGRPSYSANTAGRQDLVLGSGVGAPVATRDRRTGQAYFRADPLRVPRYDALRVRETIPRAGRPGERAAGSPYRVQTPQAPSQRASSNWNSGRPRQSSGAAMSNRAYSLRAR